MISKTSFDIRLEAHIDLLRERIIDEIFFALGVSKTSRFRKVFGTLLIKQANKIAQIIADFYWRGIDKGISSAAKSTLPRFNTTITSRGEELIPLSGPLLLVSNHPGGLDSLGILSMLPRNDLKALVSDVGFLHDMDADNRFYIYVDFNSIGGMVALREAIEHLNKGGVLLLFAHGEVEPDPECMLGAVESIQDWSHSIEIMLRKVPATKLQILSVSGAILPRFYNSPIARLRKSPAARQKLAEFLQVINSVVAPRSEAANLHISVSEPIHVEMFPNEKMMSRIIELAMDKMQKHMDWIKSLPT